MSKETAGNATVRGPPLGPVGERHPPGAGILPQFITQAWPQTLRADPGPYRVGPFSLLRTRRKLPITTETKGN